MNIETQKRRKLQVGTNTAVGLRKVVYMINGEFGGGGGDKIIWRNVGLQGSRRPGRGGLSTGRVIYLRPNLLHMEKLVYFLLFLLLSRRSDGSATAYTPVDVLLFLLGWFQDLDTDILDGFKKRQRRKTKKAHLE